MMPRPIPEGQEPMFFPDEPQQPELPYIPPGTQREDIPRRAGTVLNHKWTHEVEGRARGRHKVLGLYDESQRIFQTGGEMSSFVYWKLKLVTIPVETWELVGGKSDWIEIVDHERNECWRIAVAKFIKNAVRYDAGIGQRIGVHRDKWTVIDAKGMVRQEGS